MPRSDIQSSPPVAAGEIECPRCGTVALNSDFCACGEYLAWELKLAAPEAEDAPAPEPPAYRPPEPPAPRASTLVTLRDPAREDAPDADVSVSVVPGAEVTVLATIRNQGEIVDTFDVRVDGLPDDWWTVSPATVFLNPWGTSGDYQLELQVRLHPPRAPASEARAWPLRVVARSRSLGEDVASAEATLTVQPFVNTLMTVGPERVRGRRHGRFDVAVANHGNGPVQIAVGARDTDERCPVSIGPALMTVPVGASAAAIVIVDVPHPLIFGRPVDHHVDVTHRVASLAPAGEGRTARLGHPGVASLPGVESDPKPQRVTFQQRPWLPWWMPPAVALLAAFITVVVMLTGHPEAPDLSGRTVTNATKLLKRHDLRVGRVTYEPAPKGVLPYSIISQVPDPGAEVVRDTVDIVIAAAPKTGLVPSVTGRTLAQATDALTAAHFGNNAQPPSAGDDWVVIRQDPAPGAKSELSTPVTLAVQQPTPSATPAPSPTPTPATTPTPMPTASASPAASAAPAATPKAKVAGGAAPATTATVAKVTAKLPADLVFASAATGQLYRWASADAKPTRLTSPVQRFEMPAPTADGYVAVQLTSSGRRLVRISSDGKTVDAIATGDYSRPVFSPERGLVAVIAAGTLCVLDPKAPATPGCAPASGQPVAAPSWSPDGRSVLVLGASNQLLSYAAEGGDATQWTAPKLLYRSATIRSAVWAGNDRIALLLASRRGAPAHLRVLARRPDGSFRQAKDLPHLTGSELAATGHNLVLRRGSGSMVLLDVDRAQPPVRALTRGSNPAWAG
jgi:beta-lactam-binding protein with PASTA domain